MNENYFLKINNQQKKFVSYFMEYDKNNFYQKLELTIIVFIRVYYEKGTSLLMAVMR